MVVLPGIIIISIGNSDLFDDLNGKDMRMINRPKTLTIFFLIIIIMTINMFASGKEITSIKADIELVSFTGDPPNIIVYIIKKDADSAKIIRFSGMLWGGSTSTPGKYDVIVVKAEDSYKTYKISESNIPHEDFSKIWNSILSLGELKDKEFDWGNGGTLNYPAMLTINYSDNNILKKITWSFSQFPESTSIQDDPIFGEAYKKSLHYNEMTKAEKFLGSIEEAKTFNTQKKGFPEAKDEIVKALLKLYKEAPYFKIKNLSSFSFYFKEQLMIALERFNVKSEGNSLLKRRQNEIEIATWLRKCIEYFDSPKDKKFSSGYLKEYFGINAEQFSSKEEVAAYIEKRKKEFIDELFKAYKSSTSEVEKEIAKKILLEDYSISPDNQGKK